ncbi:MAG: glycosyltransferase family A protein [Patescibacteria group bacterium]
MTPLISVIIPSYQHANTVKACLESVLNQSYQPLEIIIVNDGSTDGTEEILRPYFDRIVYHYQQNSGGNAARNAGFKLSQGEFIIFCDADAVLERDMLGKMVKQLEAHPDTSYCYSGFRFGWKSFPSYPFSAERLKKMNFIHTTTLIRRADFPGFDETLRRFQDWDVWLTMLEHGKQGVFINEELFHIEDDRERKGISEWRPSFVYRIPWKKVGWAPTAIKKYEAAKAIIMSKHHL